MQLQLDQEHKELKIHGSYGFPLRISHERLSWFDTESFALHWHPEIELTYVLEGTIAYQVNESLHHLRPGDGLFCNTNVIHSGQKWNTPDCHYLSITFHPRLLYGYSSSVLQLKYVEPILRDDFLSSIHFTTEEPWMKEVISQLAVLYALHESQPEALEIQAQIALLSIWNQMYQHLERQNKAPDNSRDTERIRRIVEYIHAHYAEPVALEDLAAQVHLCKSESCRLFKRYMRETMFDYLIKYRIDRSLDLLKSSGMNITQVAEAVGFSSPGYFTRCFRERMSCTPLIYRRKQGGFKGGA